MKLLRMVANSLKKQNSRSNTPTSILAPNFATSFVPRSAAFVFAALACVLLSGASELLASGPVFGTLFSLGFLSLLVGASHPALRRVAVPIATFGAVLGGAVSPALVLASGFFFCCAAPAEKSAPFPRTLLLMWCWLTAEIAWEGLRFYQTYADVGSLYLSQWVEQQPRLLRQAQVVAAFLLLNEIARRPLALRSCIPVLPWCIGTALVYFAAQFAVLSLQVDLPGWITAGLAPFFAQQMRVAGTFVDPNSAGIALAGAAVCFLVLKRWIWLLVTLLALLTTGSRSGVLIVIVFIFVRWMIKLKQFDAPLKRTRLLGLSCLVVSLAAAVIVIANLFPVDSLRNMPAGVERIALSLRIDTFEEASFSRTALWRIAFAQWTHATTLGVGLERYRELLPPFSQALNIATGAWNDNPGSWPIFLVVELGLIGLLMLVLDLTRLRLTTGGLTLVSAFGVALFFGCHTHDPFGGCVYGAVLAYACVDDREGPSAQRIRFGTFALPLFFVPFIVWTASTFPRGLFAWEMHAGVLARWTGPRADISVSCASAGPIVSPAPPEFGGQSIMITSAERAISRPAHELDFIRLGALVCPPSPINAARRLSLTVTPARTPREVGLGSDPRSLGRLLSYPTPIALDDL